MFSKGGALRAEAAVKTSHAATAKPHVTVNNAVFCIQSFNTGSAPRFVPLSRSLRDATAIGCKRSRRTYKIIWPNVPDL